MTPTNVGKSVLVRSGIPPFDHALHLLIGPTVKVNGFDSTDMRAHATMVAGAANADEDTNIP